MPMGWVKEVVGVGGYISPCPARAWTPWAPSPPMVDTVSPSRSFRIRAQNQENFSSTVSWETSHFARSSFERLVSYKGVLRSIG